VLHINKSNAAGNSKRLYTPDLECRVWTVFPVRKFYTEQKFILGGMQLHNHVDTLVQRFNLEIG